MRSFLARLSERVPGSVANWFPFYGFPGQIMFTLCQINPFIFSILIPFKLMTSLGWFYGVPSQIRTRIGIVFRLNSPTPNNRPPSTIPLLFNPTENNTNKRERCVDEELGGWVILTFHSSFYARLSLFLVNEFNASKSCLSARGKLSLRQKVFNFKSILCRREKKLKPGRCYGVLLMTLQLWRNWSH